jgi:hypothetical protein
MPAWLAFAAPGAEVTDERHVGHHGGAVAHGVSETHSLRVIPQPLTAHHLVPPICSTQHSLAYRVAHMETAR